MKANTQLQKSIPGILLCLAISIVAWYLGNLLPVIGGAVFAIIIGILLRLVINTETHFKDGIKFSTKKILQFSIILLGFNMNIIHVMQTGVSSLVVMVISLLVAFLTAFFLGRALKLTGNVKTLVGVGTAICGGSAIAATAPVIDASEEEIVQSISTIFLFNIVAVFLFPFLGHVIGMSDQGFGIWSGTAINDTSSVVAAASTWSVQALDIATVTKLTRTLMIIPITFVLSLMMAKRKKGLEGQESKFKITDVFPYFIIGFVVASLVATFTNLPTVVENLLVEGGRFLIIVAMAGIGLSTNLVSLAKNGKKPILLGLVCWASVAVSTLVILVLVKGL